MKKIGELASDKQEQIDTITWTVYGKIKKVVRTASSALLDLEFNYDPSGNRISKIVKPHGSSKENGGADQPLRWTYTYYVRDAQGNELVVYQQKLDTVGTNISLSYKETERNIYGSSRLGTQVGETEMIGALPLANIDTINHYLGNIHYEAANHLGNVLSVFTDKKIPIQSITDPTLIAYYEPDIISSTDYYPFGAPLYGRTFNSSGFRFGFNGMEKDNEVYGTGNAYTTEFRELDTRLGGRWWSIDPKMKAFESPYVGFSDNPIAFNDPMGDKIRGTREEKRALKKRSDWKTIKGTYQNKLFKRSKMDLDLIQTKNPVVTKDISNARIQPEPLSGGSSQTNQDYLYFTPLTETVKEAYSFFGIKGITIRQSSRSSKNKFLSGTIKIGGISNVDGYGMDRIVVTGGYPSSPNATPLFNGTIPEGTAGIVPSVASILFGFSGQSKKIYTVWSNDNSPLHGAQAGRVKIKIVGIKFIDKRFQ